MPMTCVCVCVCVCSCALYVPYYRCAVFKINSAVALSLSASNLRKFCNHDTMIKDANVHF